MTSDNPRSEEPAAIIDEIVAGRRGRRRGRARPARRDRAGRSRLAARRRRRRDRRQGPRAGTGVRRRHRALRRPRRRPRGAAAPRSADVIPLALDEVRAGSGELDRRRARRDHRRADRLAPGRARRPVRRGRPGRPVPSTTLAFEAAAATLVPRRRVRGAARRSGRLSATGRARSVVGITGSTGKTSTKDILAALCAPVARTVAAEAQLQQRDRRPADALPARARHRGLHRGAGDARLRADRRALRDRAAGRGRRSPTSGRCTSSWSGRSRAWCVRRAELVAALPAGGIGVVPVGLPGRPREDIERRSSSGRSEVELGRRGAPIASAAPRSPRLHGPPPGGERGSRPSPRSTRSAAARGRRERGDVDVLALARRGAAARRRRPR